ncbi:MAG: hypothetical protein E7504_07460 [Ruminococcus sp.]|nr:hypothetical protein [Ruminococcus sp.]
MSDQKDLNQGVTQTPAAEDTEKIDRMNRIRQSLAQANGEEKTESTENADLPKPKQKAASKTQLLDVSVEDNPPPVEGSEETRAQKVAQIREALSMVDRTPAPQPQPAKKSALPPLRKKGTKSAAVKNAAAETVVSPQRPQAKAAQQPAAQKPKTVQKPAAAPQVQKNNAAQVQKPAAPTAVKQPLPALRKAGTAKPAAVPAKGEATPAMKPVKTAAKPQEKPVKEKTADKPKKKLPIGKISAILGGSAGGALLIAYIIVAIVYSNKFLPNTYINKVSVGGMSKQEAHDALMAEAEVADLELITSEGETVTFPAEEYDAYYSLELEKLDEAFSENSILWIRKLFAESSYTVEYDINYDDKVMQLMFERYGWGSDPSKDAYIEMNPETQLYEIVPETIGDKFDKSTLTAYVGQQLRTGNFSIDIVESGSYDNYLANIKAEDLTEHLELCNKYAKCAITFDFSDRKEVLDGATIASWVYYTQEGKTAFNRGPIEDFVAEMANKYDTYGRPRTFRSTLDGVITVPWTKTSIYGWQIDQEATTEQILELLETGESVTVEPKYTNWGYGFTRDTNDIGGTYIEIDISAQHIWYYKNGIINMEADCVTGTETDRSRRTPRGIFQIWSHDSPRKLGTMATHGYEVWVDYWMPIDYTGIGLHDMKSRGAFGGSIYMYSGSHGCINLPYKFVKNLFNTVVNGTPVIVHD